MIKLIFLLVLSQWHVVVDDHVIEFQNPKCAECVIDQDITVDLTNKRFITGTEFIFKGGFE